MRNLQDLDIIIRLYRIRLFVNRWYIGSVWPVVNPVNQLDLL